jgi:hypothetical protein
LDPALPFATGSARLRQLYLLPLNGEERELLVIARPEDAPSAFSPPTDVVLRIHAPDGTSGAPAPHSCDAVALPDTLSRLGPAGLRPRAGPGSRCLLQWARDALRPGGTLVGHVQPCLSLHGLRTLVRDPRQMRPAGELLRFATAARCRRTLERAGFVDVETYFVEPRIDAPMALISSQPAAARTHFVRTVRRNRAMYSSLGFALRLALAQVMLGGMLQPQVFFWARRPC